MRKKTIYLISVVTIPTIIWSIVGFLLYSNFREVIPIKPLESLEALYLPFWVASLFLLTGYLVSIAFGLLFVSEKEFWED